MGDALRIGFRPPRSLFAEPARLAALVRAAETGGLDRLVVGDHVGFRGGQGFDGLVQATVLAALSSRIVVGTAVYLLPLRHPVPVARQVATLAEFAPGRVEFGVGIGGEDPAEYRICGVDRRTRGARTDEALTILRPLLAGETVTFRGTHFDVADVVFRPAPRMPVPLLVGGRSEAALRRVARFGDGWIAVWVSPGRFAEGVARIAEIAHTEGRVVPEWRHTMHVWCGIGPDREQAVRLLAAEMEGLYALPFARFERYCPAGRPEDVAAALAPYVETGCRDINLIAVGPNEEVVLDGTLAIRDLLGPAARRRTMSAAEP